MPSCNIMYGDKCKNNLSKYRLFFFLIVSWDWFFNLPHYPLDTVPGISYTDDESNQQTVSNGRDQWFSYDQFEFLQRGILPTLQGDGILERSGWVRCERKEDIPFKACSILRSFGVIVGLTASLFSGVWSFLDNIHCERFFTLFSGLFTLLYFARFFSIVHMFTNHYYLYFLISLLLTLTGGGLTGRIVGKEKLYNEKIRLRWSIFLLRSQHAIIYIFASVWKVLSYDWIDGSIVKGIMISFEEQGVARGVPWKYLYKKIPLLFIFVGAAGLLLDFSMAIILTFHKPTLSSERTFKLLSILFHSFTCLSMSQRIGYSFPSMCIVASFFLFNPLRNDASLLTWIYRYTTSSSIYTGFGRQIFALIWISLQFLLPLRMLLISNGEYPYTSRGYRFSWTMMLHSKSDSLFHKGVFNLPDGTQVKQPIKLQFSYLLPSCKSSFTSNGHRANVPILRRNYLDNSINLPFEDPRTLPLNLILSPRHLALLGVYPRYIARVSRGVANILENNKICNNTNGGQIQVHGVQFAQLNQKGPFSRIFDPTVDLVEVEIARSRRRSKMINFLGSLREIVMDSLPTNHEYLLTKGIGSSKGPWMNEFLLYVKNKYPGNEIALVADRKGCLLSKPLILRPQGYPLAIMATSRPCDLSSAYLPGFFLKVQMEKKIKTYKYISIVDHEDIVLFALSIEIGIDNPPTGQTPYISCGRSEIEDVLIAFVMLA